MKRSEAKKLWQDRVYDKQDEVDPDGERDWWDLAYGFFLALGFDAEEAAALANEVPL